MSVNGLVTLEARLRLRMDVIKPRVTQTASFYTMEFGKKVETGQKMHILY